MSKYIREVRIIHETVGHYVTIGEDFGVGVRIAQYESDGSHVDDICFDREQVVEIAKAILDMYELEVLLEKNDE